MRTFLQFATTLIFVTVLATVANATIYLVAAEPSTHSVGVVVISSGPVVTYSPHAVSGIKGVGFTGWSGDAFNISPAMDKVVFEMMQNSMPAEKIANYVDSQIHNKYSRYIFISTQGTMGYVFPPRGCAEPECGVLMSDSKQFFVMGGGLEHEVVQKTVQAYEPIHQSNLLPLECKLLAGLQTIINVGGEIKEFKEANIAIDNPSRPQQEWFKSAHVPEAQIPANLKNQIAALGIHCPELHQAGRIKQTFNFSSRIIDLK